MLGYAWTSRRSKVDAETRTHAGADHPEAEASGDQDQQGRDDAEGSKEDRGDRADLPAVAGLLDREIFDTLLEAKVLVERWRRHYNVLCPHSALGCRPPTPEAIVPRLHLLEQKPLYVSALT
jgi:hypothetical protein